MGPDSWLRRHLLAGLCCGLAISSEYTAAIAAGGVLALALLTTFKRGLILSLAAIPALLLIPAYNWICFGGPLSFGYHHLAVPEFQAMNQGLFGITFPPKLTSAYLILFSPERGLFFWTPFFLLAFAGMGSAMRASGRLAYFALSIIVLQTLCISGYYMPSGGSALGPRHLAPIIPYLAIVVSFGLKWYPRVGASFGHWSLLLTGSGTSIDPMPPDNIGFRTMISFFLARLDRHDAANFIGEILGFSSWFGVAIILIGIQLLYLRYFFSFASIPRAR